MPTLTAPPTASVQAYNAISDTTGNSVVFAQRYAADGSPIGDPVQITADSVNATVAAAPLLLTNDGFVVPYNFRNENEPFGYLATTEILPDVTSLGVNTLVPNDYPATADFDAIALDNGAYAYVLTVGQDQQGVEVESKTLAYVNAGGVTTLLQAPLDQTEFSGAPYYRVQGPTSLARGEAGTFTVAGADIYSPDSGGGQYRYRYVYSDTGKLITSSVIDTNDGFRESYVQVSGKPYTAQDTKTIDGVAQSLYRYFADGSPLLISSLNRDGTTTTINYSAPGGAHTTVTSDASSRIVTADGYDATGVVLSSDTRNPDGTRIVQLPGKTVSYAADGSRQEFSFYLPGRSYATQTSYFNASGNLTRTDRNYADGSLAFRETVAGNGAITVQNYDTSHRLTTTLGIAVNGAEEAIVRQYVGASTTASTILDAVRDANGTLLTSKVTNADGSHEQTAFVSGQTLTSTTNAPDAFAGAPGGGDTFVFMPAFGQDLATNFHAGSGLGHDTLQFASSVVPDYLHLQGLMSRHGNDTIITVDPLDTIVLKNVAPSSLTSADFSFKPDSGLV